MSSTHTIKLTTLIRRKADVLPRYVVFPQNALAQWELTGTIVVDVFIAGEDVGRRSLKPWGKGKQQWFIDLPNAICERLAIDTGDRVTITLRQASTALPTAIKSLIESDPQARQRWEAATHSQRRALREHVIAAKQESTRARRAKKALLGEKL